MKKEFPENQSNSFRLSFWLGLFRWLFRVFWHSKEIQNFREFNHLYSGDTLKSIEWAHLNYCQTYRFILLGSNFSIWIAWSKVHFFSSMFFRVWLFNCPNLTDSKSCYFLCRMTITWERRLLWNWPQLCDALETNFWKWSKINGQWSFLGVDLSKFSESFPFSDTGLLKFGTTLTRGGKNIKFIVLSQTLDL
jgi:hypothetical protein